MKGTEFAIKTNNLSKNYDTLEAVKDLNLEIKKGEVFGFLGPNGAGKTTTIRMILNFIFPTSGSLEVLGLDPTVDSHKIMESVGYISGEVALFDDYKVKEFLDFYEKMNGSKSASRKDLIERFDLDESRKIKHLSKGNKQKVAIIQACMNNPNLLVLDEPTSGLDPLLQNEFYKVIDEFKALGTTVFISSHILTEVQRVCDRVGIIKAGKLISVDKVTELNIHNIHKVALTVKNQKLSKKMFSFEGVIDLEIDSSSTKFTYTGDLSILLEKLSNIKLSNVTISDPSLEDLFMHYYENEK